MLHATTRTCCGAIILSLALAAEPSIADDASLARVVPADVGLFVELRGSDDLLTALTEPQVWSSLAELVGQPARPEDAKLWRERVLQTVRMPPDEAIRTLFARGVAFVGEAPDHGQDAAVVCRPASSAPTAALLKRWNATRLSQRPSKYHLHGNIGVTTTDDVLIFGDLLPPNGMLQKLSRALAAGLRAPLAANATFQHLLRRVPAQPDGILFARLAPAAVGPRPTSRSSNPPRGAFNLPQPLQDARNVLVALHRDGASLHFTAVGDAVPPTTPRPIDSVSLVSQLPREALLAWEGRVDYPGLVRAIRALPNRNALRVALSQPNQAEIVDILANAFTSRTCLAIGAVEPAHRVAGAPPLPALALLVGTSDADATALAFENLLNSALALYNVFSLGRGFEPLPDVRPVTIENTSASVLDLSGFVQKVGAGAIGELHLAWAIDDGVLVIATHEMWLRDILTARHGGKTLRPLLAFPSRPANPNSNNTVAVRLGSMATLGSRWLEFLKATAPETLSESWWRERQPARVQLGINATRQPEQRNLRVDSIDPGMPAEGLLKRGDLIIGSNNKRFATSQPARELHAGIAARPHAYKFDLTVERDGVPRVVSLPIRFFDPVQSLRRVIAVGKITKRLVYQDDYSDSRGPRGLLTIELRSDVKR